MASSSFAAALNRPTSTATGPIADVTPWELYPAPRPRSTSVSIAASSTNSEARHASMAISMPLTNTGPVQEVTPWVLAPGPAETAHNTSGLPSPSTGSHRAIAIFKSKSESKPPKRASSYKSIHSAAPSSSDFAPAPDMPTDFLSAHGTISGMDTTGIPFQRSPVATSKKSFSQISERSISDSKHSAQSFGPASSNFNWPKPGSRGGKDRKDSFNAGVTERTRPLTSTGPVEEVAPWEMYPPPLESEFRKKTASRISVPLGLSLVNLPHVTATSSYAMSPTIEMWRMQKMAGQSEMIKGVPITYYAHDDGRSKSASALPLTGGRKRARTDSAVASYHSGGERTVASCISLPLQSDRSSRDGQETAEPPRVPRSGAGPVAANKLSRGRSLTAQTPTSSKTSLRPLSASISASGHSERFGAVSMVSTMNVAQMEEVTPWDLYPIPLPVHRSTATLVSGTKSEDRDSRTVRIFGLPFFFPPLAAAVKYPGDPFFCAGAAYDCGGRFCTHMVFPLFDRSLNVAIVPNCTRPSAVFQISGFDSDLILHFVHFHFSASVCWIFLLTFFLAYFLFVCSVETDFFWKTSDRGASRLIACLRPCLMG